MALLDMVRKSGIECYVAHVNYHHRPTANRDEDIVRNYCLKYNIPFFKLDVRKYTGNFQDYARVARYKFFKKLVKKEKLNGVLVAHHKDDLIETYLLQKKRGSIPEWYGLKEKTVIQDITVIRPLLEYSKDDLMTYCHGNNIVYGIDESNLSDDYSRNRLRHSLIEKMNAEEKESLIREINEQNSEKEKEKEQIETFLNKRSRIEYSELAECAIKEKVLRYLIRKDISSRYLEELLRQLKESESLLIKIQDQYLVKEYGYIEVFDIPIDYAYRLNKYQNMHRQYFTISKKGTSLEAVTVYEDDYPLTVRNAKKSDFIVMRYGRKKLNRYFIDSKIPTRERLTYPVVVNSKEEVILVPGIGSDISHYSKNATFFCGRIK